MKNILNYGRFRGSVEYSNYDCCWYGKILCISDLVTYKAKSFEDLKEEFVIAVEDYEKTLYENKIGQS